MIATASGIQPTPITGREIAARLFTRLRRPAERVYVVTPFLQDYEFRPLQSVSGFLIRHAEQGAVVSMMTTPPDGKGPSARAKWQLLDRLQRNGVSVHVNVQLHAKIYLFIDPRMNMAMVGSANLTQAGMSQWIEVALLSYNPGLGSRIERMTSVLLNRPDTLPLRRWALQNPQVKAF